MPTEIEHAPLEPLLGVDEAVTILGVSRTTVWRRIAAGEIAVVRIGRSVKIEPRTLREYVRARSAPRNDVDAPGSASSVRSSAGDGGGHGEP